MNLLKSAYAVIDACAKEAAHHDSMILVKETQLDARFGCGSQQMRKFARSLVRFDIEERIGKPQSTHLDGFWSREND